MAAVFAADAFFDGVTIKLAGDLALKLRAIGVDVFVDGQVKDRTPEKLVQRISRQRTGLRIPAQELAFRIHLDDADAGMLVSDGETPFLRASVNLYWKLFNQIRARLKSGRAGGMREDARPGRRSFLDAHLALHRRRLVARAAPGKCAAF